MTNLRVVWVALVLSLLGEHLHGIKIEFFKGPNFTDLLYESSSNAKCINLPADKNNTDIRSIRTNTCLMVYYWPNCQATSRKFDLQNNWSGWKIRSFHICNADVGGLQLNIDITNWYNVDSTPTAIPDVIESHKNVCTCINVPKQVQSMKKWSINNYGNNVLAYYEPECSAKKWEPMNIPAGHWESAHMHSKVKTDSITNTKYKIQSLGPDPKSKYFQASCTQYLNYWIIMKVEQLETLTNSSQRAQDEVNEDTNVGLNLELGNDRNRIVFFTNSSFHGLHLEANSTVQCKDMTEIYNGPIHIYEVGSIKTETCVMLYSENKCMGRSIKLYAGNHNNLKDRWEATVTGPKTLSTLYTSFPNWSWFTRSFHSCNEREGGLHLNVDLIEYKADVELNDVPKIHINYTKVCSCINVPYNIQILPGWSIDNHGNSMIAYFEHDCNSVDFSPLWIPAGQSSYSIGLSSFKKTQVSTGIVQSVKSFGPDTNAQYYNISCFKFKPKVTSEIGMDISLKEENDQIKNITERLADLERKVETVVKTLENIAEQTKNTLILFEEKLEKQKNDIRKIFA